MRENWWVTHRRTMSTLAPYLTSAAEEGGAAPPTASATTSAGGGSRTVIKQRPQGGSVEYRLWGATIVCDSPCRINPQSSQLACDGDEGIGYGYSHCRMMNVSLVEESSGTPSSSVCRVINQGFFELSITPITHEGRVRNAIEEDRLVICTIAPGESRTINITFNYEVMLRYEARRLLYCVQTKIYSQSRSVLQ